MNVCQVCAAEFSAYWRLRAHEQTHGFGPFTQAEPRYETRAGLTEIEKRDLMVNMRLSPEWRERYG